MTDNVIAFGKKVNSIPELLEEIMSIANDMQAVMAMGKREGYEFSVQELIEYINEIPEKQTELSDAELDQVAGGGGSWPPPPTHPIICDGEFHG